MSTSRLAKGEVAMSSERENESNKKPSENSSAPRDIFRKVSLERLANPEQLDNLLLVVTSKVYLTWIALFFLGALFVAWLLLGGIPIQILGRGIVVNPQGMQFYIPAKFGGMIRQIEVKSGMPIEKGALIAEIFDFKEELKQKNIHLKIVDLESELKVTQAQIDQKDDESYLEALQGTLKKLQAALKDAKKEQELLETRSLYYKIYSPAEGRILEVLASVGDHIDSGNPLVWMEHLDPESTAHYIYGYFPIEAGKRLNIGEDVKIKLSTVDSQEYGYLLGKVKQISDYAVSKQSILKLIHNKELTDYLTWDNQAVIQVLIAVKTKPISDGQDEYYWTSGKTPPIEVTAGTICEIQAIVGHITPIYYFLPLSFLKLPGEE